ncbi:MAG: purine nucleoside phosphorylase 1 [Oligoflexia bacterium]|nr:MAG: purine nucleoside phosphorylase 1 [Oligoflexia bacterium]
MKRLNHDELLKKINEAVAFIRSKTKQQPQVGIVLGSGLGSFVQQVANPTVIPFTDIPNFLPTTVEGHSGNLVIGTVEGKEVIVMQGRNHYYEGHSMDSVIFPVRVLAKLGIKTLILTNSAGGMKDGMSGGDLMIIEDHINLMGTNPLIGPNISEFGPRFPDMSEAYDKELIKKLESSFTKLKVKYQKGVYGGLTGPTYETPAEVRYLKRIGCDAVGMSTVHECIIANHMGLRVAGISCISNLAAGISPHKLSHAEVTDTAKKVEKDFVSVLKDFVSAI